MMEVLQNWKSIALAKPEWLFACALLFLLIPVFKRLRPAFAHTHTGIHKIRSSGWPGKLCMLAFSLMWIAFCVALAQPMLAHSEMHEYMDARDFVVGIDRSGSMFSADIESAPLRATIDNFEQSEKDNEKALRALFPTLYPYEPQDEKKVQKVEEGKVQRFQLARYAAFQFLKSRPKGDRAAMFTFDDDVYWSWPLGKDINVVLRKIGELSKESGGGTNFDGPSGGNTHIGAFQATLDQFDSLAKAKTRVIIFISDGDAGISAERHQYFVEQMKKEGQQIHIFALVCGAPTQVQNASTQSLRRLVEEVNPQDWKDSKGDAVDAVIWAGNGEAMQKAFDRISELEKSTIELEPVDVHKDVTGVFILLGALLGLGFIGASVVFRESF